MIHAKPCRLYLQYISGCMGMVGQMGGKDILMTADNSQKRLNKEKERKEILMKRNFCIKCSSPAMEHRQARH